jgi:hypothetical protein
MRTIVLALVLSVFIAVPAVAVGSVSRAASNCATFSDSTGEDVNGPDITSTVVCNDDAGIVTFQVNISNRPLLTADMVILLFLDTDRNGSTGDPQNFGADYAIQLVAGQVSLFQWNGSDYVVAQSQSSLTFSYAATGATIRVSASELGMTKGFNFAVLAASGISLDSQGNQDFTNAHTDLSPDPGHGTFAYQVLTRLTLSVVAFSTSPKPARAGKTFSAALTANESDTGALVQQGRITCVARIAGRKAVLKASRLVDGVAACVWSIPKTARDKTIRGTITLTVQGVRVTRSFAATIT